MKSFVEDDTYSYKGWLNSDSFIQRSFAVLGYCLVSVLMIYAVLIVIALIVGFFIGLASV